MGYTITLFIGGILFLFSLLFLGDAIRFLHRSVKTPATITRIEMEKDSDGDYTYQAIYSFRTITDEEMQFRSPFKSSKSKWVIGESATIVYNPGNPKDAKLYTYFGTLGLPVVLMALAMPFIVIGLGYWLSRLILK